MSSSNPTQDAVFWTNNMPYNQWFCAAEYQKIGRLLGDHPGALPPTALAEIKEKLVSSLQNACNEALIRRPTANLR